MISWLILIGWLDDWLVGWVVWRLLVHHGDRFAWPRELFPGHWVKPVAADGFAKLMANSLEGHLEASRK